MGYIDIKSTPAPIKAFFNGIAQVVFIENVISGIIIWASFLVAGFEQNMFLNGMTFAEAAGNFDSWKFFLFTAIGVNVGNLTAKIMNLGDDAIKAGLYGFTPTLVSIASGVFPGDYMTQWVMLFLGCVLVIPIQQIINNLCARFGLPGFTMPFIAIVWFFVLMSFQSDLLFFNRAGLVSSAQLSASYESGWPAFSWLRMLTTGYEEIYVLDGVISSLMVLAAYFVFSARFAFTSMIAVGVSIGIGFLFGLNLNDMGAGLYTYSAILTIGGLETFSQCKDKHLRYWTLAFFGMALTVFINFAIPTILQVFALPNCTFAFVTGGWLTLYLEQHFAKKDEAKLAEN